MGSRRLFSFARSLFVCLALVGPALLRADPTWTLVWDDEFNGSAGTPPDPTRWTYDLGGGGWGNGELETYTNATANVEQDGSGHLAITAVDTAGSYTSARLKTQGLFDQAYGRVEASIQIPWGVGVWPAFWMLGSNIASSGWPACGEIDLMENIGQYDASNVIGGHIHGPVAPGGGDYNGGSGVGTNYTLPSGTFTSGFHLFAAEWSPTQIVFYVDGTAYQTLTAADLPSGGTWVFNHPFFILLNLAVGGTAGSPSGTAFPQTMLVDYVRVYKLTDNGTAPYGGSPAALPGVVQAENYDSYTDALDPSEPGEGFAYNGLGPTNIPGAYRPGDAVSVEACSDTGGGYDVTDTSPGQWLQYSVSATASGLYQLDARVASSGQGGDFHVDVDGNTVTGEIAVPSTGGWQSWGDVRASGITLSAGAHKVLLVEDSEGAANQGVCNFNYLDFTLVSPTATPCPTASATSSATASPRPTETGSSTSTATSTPSATATGTPTSTASPRPTETGSSTPTAAVTPTPSATASATSSATVSPLPTQIGSATATAAATPAPSATASATATASPLPTQIGSATATAVATPASSVTASATQSATASPISTGTDSATATASATASATSSSTASPMPTATGSATATVTATATPSATASATFSATASPLSTATGSATATVTATATPRATASTTFSATASPTSTGTGGSTRTPTQASGGPLVIQGIFGVPNPNPRELAVDLAGPADALEVRIYTKALVLAMEFGTGPLGAGWNPVALPGSLGRLPNGLYYVQVTAGRGPTVSRAVFSRMMILR